MSNKQKAWICLIISGLVEIVWAYFLKKSYGFTEPTPTIIAILFIAMSFFLLERGVREFGIGVSYGIFTGIGIAGTTVIGITALGESISFIKIFSLIVLIIGIAGLKFSEGGRPRKKGDDGKVDYVK